MWEGGTFLAAASAVAHTNQTVHSWSGVPLSNQPQAQLSPLLGCTAPNITTIRAVLGYSVRNETTAPGEGMSYFPAITTGEELDSWRRKREVATL